MSADHFWGITDIGRQRTNNEDAFFVTNIKDNAIIAACVIDGVGGYEGGEVAASIAHDCIKSSLRWPVIGFSTTLVNGFINANAAIIKEKQLSSDKDQMACVVTAVIADLSHNTFTYCHVGDTRLYLMRDGSLIKISKDHSFVGFLEDNGRLSEGEAMNHPRRNEINKALGFIEDIQAEYMETGESPFLPGDILMLCSDGLSDVVPVVTLSAILTGNGSLNEKAQNLIDAANNAGGKDNITVALIYNSNEPLSYTATLPMPHNAVAEKKSSKVMQDEHLKNALAKRKKKVPWFLVFLIVLILGATGWIIFLNEKKYTGDRDVQMKGVKHMNKLEEVIATAMNNPSMREAFVINSEGNEPLIITETIFINKDTLHVMGNGIHLVSHTDFKGPAFKLGVNCKMIIIDSMLLENFDIGITAPLSVLHLRKVHFNNCKVSVQYNYVSTDSSGPLDDKQDSVLYNSSNHPNR